MNDAFSTANLRHVAVRPVGGDAAHRVISAEDFADAWAEITEWEGYAPTPLVALPGLAKQIGVGRIDYKHEGARFGLGSFKALGGAYAAMRVLQREVGARLGRAVSLADISKGVYAEACSHITLSSATDGNHGRSLAWGCKRVGAPCRIYIHSEVSAVRAQAMRDLGAEVVRIDGDYDESVNVAKAEADKNGWFVVSDTSWQGYHDVPRDVMAGYGVMTREACETLNTPPTHVFLQGGVGGLAASVAGFLRQYWGDETPRVIIVEPELAPCLYESARQAMLITVKINEETIMAGLSCGAPSAIAWEILRAEASDYITIPDNLVAPTMRLLANAESGDEKVESGESAVAGLASLIAVMQDVKMASALKLNESARVLLFGSEGITDPAIFKAIMQGSNSA